MRPKFKHPDRLTNALFQDIYEKVSRTQRGRPLDAVTRRTIIQEISRAQAHQALNVAAMGIDYTGTNSVTASVQQIIDAASDGDSLYFPHGTYLFTDTDADGICCLIEDKKLSIKGDFPGTIFKCDGELDILRKYSASNLASVRNQYPLFVDGIVFDCRNGAAGVVFYYDGVTDQYMEGEIRQCAFFMTGVAPGGRDSIGHMAIRAREPYYTRIYMAGMRPDGTNAGSSLFCKPAPSGGLTKTVRWKDSQGRWETREELWDVDIVASKNENSFINGVGFYFAKTVGPAISGLQIENLAYGVWADGGYGKDFLVSINASTDVLTANGHTYAASDGVQFISTGTLPGGISASTTYFIRDVTTNTFKVSATDGGAAVDITSAGTGDVYTKAIFNAGRQGSPFDAGLRLSNVEGIGCWHGVTVVYNDYLQIDPSVIFDYCEHPLRIFGNDQGITAGWWGLRQNQSRKAACVSIQPYVWGPHEMPFDEMGFTSHLKIVGPNVLAEPGFDIGGFSSFNTAPAGHDLINLTGTTAFALWAGQVFKIVHGSGGTYSAVEFTVFEDTAAGSSAIKVSEGGSAGASVANDRLFLGVAQYNGMLLDRMQHMDMFGPVIHGYSHDGVRYRDVIESLWVGGRLASRNAGSSGSDINWDYTGSWATDSGQTDTEVKEKNPTFKIYFVRHDLAVDIDDSGLYAADKQDNVGSSGVIENIGGGHVIEDPRGDAGDPFGYGIRINTFGAFSRGFKVYDESGLCYAGFFAKGNGSTNTFENWYISGNDASDVPEISTKSWIYGDMDGADRRVVVPNGNFNIGTTKKYLVGGTQVMAARVTGWAAPTGTATRTTFATSTVTLPELAERVKALLDDLTTHGLIGP